MDEEPSSPLNFTAIGDVSVVLVPGFKDLEGTISDVSEPEVP